MIKNIVISIFCIVSCFSLVASQAQNTQDSLSYTKLLKLSQTADFEKIRVKFNNVIEDSRCPKNVTCIRAGEAIIEILVYKNEKLIRVEKLIIDASGFVADANNLIYSFGDIKIYGFGLYPYPHTEYTIKNEDYRLEVGLRPNN